MTWGEIKNSGRPYYETIIDGVFCRFYEHPNGGWSVRMHNQFGVAILHESTKREIWDECRKIARRQATNPEMSPQFLPNYTEDIIRQGGGVPNVVCRAGVPA